ncbi:EutP/PduV family microcompartment system protein [Brevibacillus nitrificans]|uniref:EutP/PduV family microcompartment system protein n=1 Tax=Brevibacillus nitrificans TaxID=651560 RepID=UPI00260B1EE3|nr:EutP/PduV family microcompartment system protein [Brevibacillus nitrificans]
MKKVFLIGSVASGKTTLAKRLSEKMNVPWFEHDSIVYQQTPKGRCKIDSWEGELFRNTDETTHVGFLKKGDRHVNRAR